MTRIKSADRLVSVQLQVGWDSFIKTKYCSISDRLKSQSHSSKRGSLAGNTQGAAKEAGGDESKEEFSGNLVSANFEKENIDSVVLDVYDTMCKRWKQYPGVADKELRASLSLARKNV